MSRNAPRTIRLERSRDDRGVGALSITAGKAMHTYAFKEIPSEFGGRGFMIHKLGVNPVYHVHLGKPADCSCECLGFYRHDHCKHIDGLNALIQAEKI